MQSPSWSNVFIGRISHGKIAGKWVDVTKGTILGTGTLHLAVQQNGNKIVATQKNGGFGGSAWTKQGQTSQPSQTSCAISGHVSGQKQYVKMMGIYGPDDFKKKTLTDVDGNGDYRIINLSLGKYTVVPIPGGKFGLKSSPQAHTVECTGGEIPNINFTILGIDEG